VPAIRGALQDAAEAGDDESEDDEDGEDEE